MPKVLKLAVGDIGILARVHAKKYNLGLAIHNNDQHCVLQLDFIFSSILISSGSET